MSSEEVNKAIATARELIAAGKKAASEGQAIIAQRQKDWSGGAGCAHPRPVLKPEPKSGSPDYVLTSTDYDNVKAVVSMMKITKISKSPGLRAAAYRDVGTRIDELRQNRDEAEWSDILHRECGLSSRRARELMAMATGAKPPDQLRSGTSTRVKNHIERKAA
jgi:hypothetical protein